MERAFRRIARFRAQVSFSDDGVPGETENGKHCKLTRKLPSAIPVSSFGPLVGCRSSRGRAEFR